MNRNLQDYEKLTFLLIIDLDERKCFDLRYFGILEGILVILRLSYSNAYQKKRNYV